MRERKPKENHTVSSDIVTKIAKMLDVPRKVVSVSSQTTVSGNREAIVDGCQGILEYTNESIRINAGKLVIKFAGRGLDIKYLSSSTVIIGGYITGIEYIE